MDEMPPQVFEFEEYRVDAAKRQLTRHGEQIPLTPKVFDTLLYLVRNRGAVIGKDVLMREIWTDSIVEENNLNQNISILRKIFGEKPGEQRFIVTVAGHGYRFVPETRESVSTIAVISEPRIQEDFSGSGPSQSSNLKAQTENPAATSRDPHSRRASRLLPVTLLMATVVGVAWLGFYLSRLSAPSGDQPIKSIAVLPFKPLVVETRNEELELGMADTLIAKLSGVREISVRPLSAIRRYTSIEQDSLTAGRELGVESVLDGTIQNWGNRIRVSATLVRISDGKQLWAGQFDEKFTDILSVQDIISEKVATALRIRLSGAKRSTENVEAYQLYMKGRYLIEKGTPVDLQASIPLFQQAIDLDPGYALAYTKLAHAYGVLGISGGLPPAEAIAKSKSAGIKAIEIDDTLVEAHQAVCMGIFWHDWDWLAAEKECLKAIELDPDNADSHGHYAMILSSTGRHTEALTEARRSRELNPLNLVQSSLEGQFLLYAGHTDEALDRLKKTSELEPRFWMPHMIAAGAYIEKGMLSDAVAESNKEFELSGGRVIPFGAYALAKSGKVDQARSELNELLKLSETNYVSPYNLALICSALGERENAIGWLEKGYELRDPKMTFLKVEPKWNDLRSEPRFVRLMKQMNF